MKPANPTLQALLQLSAAAQLGIAVLNLALNRLMSWRQDLERMPLLLREVHQVHSWFISIILAIFAALTFRFSSEFAGGSNPVCVWLATSIAVFWGFRTFLQVAYYSSSHWRGIRSRTLIHVTLLLIYGGFTLVYLLAAINGKK